MQTKAEDFTKQLLDLELQLKHHDKYYDYSDDSRVWAAGNAEWKSIQALSNQLKLAGYSEEVQELFKKYYDDEYFFGCSRYRCEIND